MPPTPIFPLVVAGIDEHAHSDLAVRAAFTLAARLGAKVRVVHAVRGAHPPLGEIELARPDGHDSEMLTAAWKGLRSRVEPLLAELGVAEDVGAVLSVLPGPPAKVLLEVAEAQGGALIVIGPHEKRGLFDFGSTARAILAHQHGTGAVWVQKGAVHAIERVVVPIDLSEDSLNALHSACALAAALGARVTVLHAFYPPLYAYPTAPGYPTSGPTYVVDELRDSTRQRFESTVAELDLGGVAVEAVFAEGEPAEVILERAGTSDLVALGTHGHTGLTASVLGSVAYAVLKRSEVPVLAIRHPERKWLL